LLATQNPVDLDYKALSNAGTWFIGKLQTERDKLRLLDGLESASGRVSRSGIDKLISSLGKRVFIQHNVHDEQPTLFQTRWAMNFLTGPLTRAQIPVANKLVGADLLAGTSLASLSVSEVAGTQRVRPAAPVPSGAAANSPGSVPAEAAISSPEVVSSKAGSSTRPAVPASVEEHFLPTNLSLTEAMRADGKSFPDAELSGVLYKPALLAVAKVRFLNRKYDIDLDLQRAALVEEPDKHGVVRWEDHFYQGFPLKQVEQEPAPGARYDTIDAPLNVAKQMTALKRDFVDWIYRSVTLEARENKALKVVAGPDDSQAEFMKACAEAARQAADAEIEKKSAQYDRKIKSLEDRMHREERELREDESELTHRKWEEAGTHFENLIGGGRARRRISTSLTKRRMTEQAKADVEESQDALEDYKVQLEELYAEREQALAEIKDRWGNVVNDVTEVTLIPKKSDIFIELFGVAWMPYYLVESGQQIIELPAFGQE